MNSGFEILPHTADIRMRINARSMEQLFLTALQALAQVQKKGFCLDKKSKTIKEEIHCNAPDRTALLIDFLSEVLTMSHISKAVFCDADFHQLNDNSLVAVVTGYPADELDEDIKAVTYHEAQIENNDQKEYSTVIVLDI